MKSHMSMCLYKNCFHIKSGSVNKDKDSRYGFRVLNYRMNNIRGIWLLAILLIVGMYLTGSAIASPSVTIPRYKVSNKEIHLKHGRLHPHYDDKQESADDHDVYRYRWVEDDIVKSEGDFEGEEDDDYAEDKRKKVKLAGGCELTENQFFELESFKKETEYVKKCYCENGGVYCQINRALLKHKMS